MSWREIYEFMTGDLAEVMVCAAQSSFLPSVPRRRLIRMELAWGRRSSSDCCRRFLTAAAAEEKAGLDRGVGDLEYIISVDPQPFGVVFTSYW